MKKLVLYTILLLIMVPFSCSEDFLERYPLDKLSSATFDPELSINGCYDYMQSSSTMGYNSWSWIEAFGPCISISRGAIIDAVSKGVHDPDNLAVNRFWGLYYGAIFRANDFINKLSEYEGLDEETKKQYEGEARFLRAYAYNRLVNMYRDVPLVTKPLSIDESYTMVKSPKQDVVNQIIEDLDYAITNLPVDEREIGTATKGAARAMKARVYLHLNNWQEAKTAAESVREMNKYDLYTGQADDSLDYAYVFDYRNENNVEVIFDVQYDSPDLGEGDGVQSALKTKNHGPLDRGAFGVQPTSYGASLYEYRDGSPGILPTKYEDFNNKDYRFYATILHPGSSFYGMFFGPGYPKYDRMSTKYAQRKYIIEYPEEYIKNDAPGNWILIRYAEVLLTYAEAQNELNGPDQSVYDAINPLRARGGLPPLPQGLTKDEMRQRIHNERWVELALEGLSWFDMLRWGKAGTLPNGMDIVEFTTVNTPTRFPDLKVVYQRQLDPLKAYVFPIPQSEVNAVPGLEQHDEWK